MRIELRRPDDFHVHFRRGHVLRTVVPFTAEQFGRAMVMPNTSPRPILTAADADSYRHEILAALRDTDHAGSFEPLMTIQITQATTPATVRDAAGSAGIIAGKLYPKGVTTGSGNGVTNIRALYPVFEEMERAGLVLSLHGQLGEAFILDREREFLGALRDIAERFPGLRIVLEHISTAEAVETVRDLPANVAGTITAHHLMLTLHDVLSWVGDDGSEGLCPHHYCQPIPQRPEDRQALLDAARSGNPKFFFGSDTAPHLRERKESACGCAGVFSAPVLLPVLLDIFGAGEQSGEQVVGAMQSFVSEFGARFYGLPLNAGTVALTREEWTVPQSCGGIVPFLAGRKLAWKVASVR